MPTYTNAIVASFQIAAALCQILITRLAQCIGGPAAAIIFRAGGVAGLAVVIFSTNRALVLAALIIRGARMNAIDGLTKSILNEHVPVDQRARWNLFALLSATGWSGTAFLGGVLADKIGYRRTFCITLGFHAASCVCLLPLLWLVPMAARHGRSATRRRVPLATLKKL